MIPFIRKRWSVVVFIFFSFIFHQHDNFLQFEVCIFSWSYQMGDFLDRSHHFVESLGVAPQVPLESFFNIVQEHIQFLRIVYSLCLLRTYSSWALWAWLRIWSALEVIDSLCWSFAINCSLTVINVDLLGCMVILGVHMVIFVLFVE